MLSNTINNPVITIQDFQTLDKDQLIDLLQHKTKLLVTASVLKVPDHAYIETLKEEVKKLQEAIISKTN